MKAYSGVHGGREFQQSLSLRMEIEDERLCEIGVVEWRKTDSQGG